MSLTSLAMVALFAIVVLLIARAKLREKDAEMAAMATMVGMQKMPPQTLQFQTSESVKELPPEMLRPELANGSSEIREWSFGDKPEDPTKPGVHFRTHVKVRVVRKKQ